MIDLHEYVCLDFYQPEDVYITCRYCNKHIIDTTYSINTLSQVLKSIEKKAIVHLMQCGIFREVKKAEIEDSISENENESGCEI